MSALVATVLCKRRVTCKDLGFGTGNIEEFEYALGDFEVTIESPGEYTAEELEELRVDFEEDFETMILLPPGIESRVTLEGRGEDARGMNVWEWGSHFACAFDGTLTWDGDEDTLAYADAAEAERQQSLKLLCDSLRKQD